MVFLGEIVTTNDEYERHPINEWRDNYLNDQSKEVLKSVGSYKIEDNSKYNFLKILKGDYETIIGFPLKNFIKKFMKEKK